MIMTRRQMLQGAAVAGAGVFVRAPRAAAEEPRARVTEIRTISQRPDRYHGWPTVARGAGGRLLTVCSGGREAHVCPFGRVEIMESRDDGRTWTWPRILLDSAIDDRDSGVLETSRGTILATSFTSLAWEPIVARAEADAAAGKPSWPEEKLARWRGVRDRLDAAGRRADLGCWILRSTDGGRTWSARMDSIVNSPHGPIELRDGRLLYAGKKLWADHHEVGVCESTDDGASWRWLAGIPARPGDDPEKYHELHAVDAGDRIVVQIRNHNTANAGETLQSESTDGGRTWSAPHSIGVWGLPSHLLRLRSGRLLMTYGHRRPPLGCQARWSDDAGRSWSEALILHGDGASGDLGYPSTVELDDGSLLSVWYEVLRGSPQAVLRQARWSLPAI